MGWKEKYERAMARARNAAAVVGDMATQARFDAECTGAAALAGAVRGHMTGQGKKYEIGKEAKLSPELLVGGVGKFAAYVMTATKTPGASDVHALSLGPLAYRAGSVTEQHMFERAQKGSTTGRGRVGAARRELGPGGLTALQAEMRERAANAVNARAAA